MTPTHYLRFATEEDWNQAALTLGVAKTTPRLVEEETEDSPAVYEDYWTWSYYTHEHSCDVVGTIYNDDGVYDYRNINDAYRNFNLKNFAISKSINYHLLNDFNLIKKFNLNYQQNLRKKDETDCGNKEFIRSLTKIKEQLDFSTLNISEIKSKLLESNLNIRI